MKPSVRIDFKTSRYQVKTATSFSEVWQALRLRNRIFYGEFAGPDAKRKLSPIDLDKYDFTHDHLIVKDIKKNEVIATYRLRSTSFMKPGEEFYTHSEFDLTEFLKTPGGKLELGRAAVSAKYRNGTTILLLWQGLFEYAKKSQSQYLFGCSSLTPFQYSTFQTLKKEWEEKGSGPLPFKVPVHQNFKWATAHQLTEEKHDLGSLIGMYAMAGARFGEEIAHDKEMDCLDVFTLLDLEKLPESFSKKLVRK
ncbi:MAG: GNAT family N-acyltransferase [Bdellovibrionota bacterium]